MDELNPFSFSRGKHEVIEIKSVSEALDEEHRLWLLEVASQREWYLHKREALENLEVIYSGASSHASILHRTVVRTHITSIVASRS